jgi:hypothetical protein
MAGHALDAVLDGIDIETYLVCGSEREGKDLALRLGHELNLGDVDIMYQEFDGYGMRVRLRKYIHRPGETYRWLAEVRPDAGREEQA